MTDNIASKLNRANIQKAKVERDFVSRLYDRKAGYYDAWGVKTEAKARKIALEFAQIRNGEAVLEVAVGTGLMFETIVRNNPDGINEGIDLSDGMLAKAKEKVLTLPAKHVHLQRGDARSLPFPDAHFDLLINGFMFDLIPEEEFAPILAEFHRVLKADGRLVLMNMSLPRRLSDSLFEWIYRLTPKTMGGCRGVAMAPVLEETGFRVTRENYVSQWGFPSEILLASKGD